MMAAISTSNYKIGDNVFCFHGDFLYEAKIKDITTDPEGTVQYAIHYKGWKDKWDEWVLNSRIMHVTEETKRIKAELDNKLKTMKSIRRSTGNIGKETPTGSGKGRGKRKSSVSTEINVTLTIKKSDELSEKPKKKGRKKKKIKQEIVDNVEETEIPPQTIVANENDIKKQISIVTPETTVTGNNKPLELDMPSTSTESALTGSSSNNTKELLKIHLEMVERRKYLANSDEKSATEEKMKLMRKYPYKIPDKIFNFIVDSSFTITQEQKILTLPANHTVDSILTDYYTNLKDIIKDDVKLIQISEKIFGIREIFNSLLDSHLLLTFEKPQQRLLVEKDFSNYLASKIYGAAHLVRIFVHMNRQWMFTKRIETDILLQLLLNDLSEFLLENYDKYFKSLKYEQVGSDYMAYFNESSSEDSDSSND